MAHLHADMKRLDFHVALELCEIVIESATAVAILESASTTVWRPRLYAVLGNFCNAFSSLCMRSLLQ
jgi:hypothetical protein